MDETRWNRLEQKLDKVCDTLGEIKTTQAVEVQIRLVQAKSLVEHIKRTGQNERMIYFIIACLLAGGAKELGLFAQVAKLVSLL